MHNSIEHLPNVPAYIAMVHGPIVLAAKTGTQDLKGLIADDSRWGHIPGGAKLPLDKAPILIQDNLQDIAADLVPVAGKPLSFTLRNVNMINPSNVTLEPFSGIHNARYMIYWMALTSTQYKSYVDSIAKEEKEKLALEERTVDFVAPGEQQPEVDHAMQTSRSRSATAQDKLYREAANGGYFSYNLATGGKDRLSLLVQYWGAEWGNRKFEIYIDDQKLITEDNSGRWNQSAFQKVEYAIPENLIKGKDHIRVKFQSLPGSTAGGVYYIRLLKPGN
jgi:hypothetical protein